MIRLLLKFICMLPNISIHYCIKYAKTHNTRNDHLLLVNMCEYVSLVNDQNGQLYDCMYDYCFTYHSLIHYFN